MDFSSPIMMNLISQKPVSIDVDVHPDISSTNNDSFLNQTNKPLFSTPEIDDYDAKNEKFDYSSSKTAFSKPYYTVTDRIPSTTDIKYRESYLTPDNQNFVMEISRIIWNSLRQENLKYLINFVDAVRITNPTMHEKCLQFQSTLDQQNSPKDFTYLFMDMGGYDPTRESQIFNDGIACGNMPLECLGDANNGVYLSRYIDSCTVSPLIPFIPHRFLIFKVLLGNHKKIEIPDISDPPKVNLQNGWNSHSLNPIKKCNSLYHCNFYNSLVYIYDMIDRNVVNEYPRNIYPYAAVTLYINNFYEGLSQIRLPYLPKNEIGTYTLSFGSLRSFNCRAYSLHAYKPRLTELSINGINIEKVISSSNLAKSYVIKKFLSGSAGSFLNRSVLKFWSNATVPATEFFLKHTIISSDDVNFKKIVKRLQIDNQVMIFGVPWISVYTRNEEPTNYDFGFCVPNSYMSTLLGIPYFSADILHVFVLSKVLMNMMTHPLKTIIREEILMDMLSSGRIGRSDKISENDVRTAISLLPHPQIYNDDVKITNNTTIEAMDIDTNNIVPITTSTASFTSTDISINNDSITSNIISSDIYDIPKYKTLICINPSDLREETIDPNILEKILNLAYTRCNKKINSKMTIIYHDSMKSENLIKIIKNEEYLKKLIEIENIYKEKNLIEYSDPHICDRGKLSHRASLVCLLTLKRKRDFDNAVIISTLPILQSDVETFKTHKINLFDPNTFVHLLETGNNSFLL